MSRILTAWNAGFVRRWHTNVRLVEFDDRNQSHQHRVTVLLLQFFPDSSRDAIIDALVHDQGEQAWADIPYPTKRAYPAVREIGETVENTSIILQGFDFSVTNEEKQRRSWCDLLDSYIWMLRCKPDLRHRKEWIDQYHLLYNQAKEFEVLKEFDEFMNAAFEFYTE